MVPYIPNTFAIQVPSTNRGQSKQKNEENGELSVHIFSRPWIELVTTPDLVRGEERPPAAQLHSGHALSQWVGHAPYVS